MPAKGRGPHTCRKCGEFKPEAAFYYTAKGSGEVRYTYNTCAACHLPQWGTVKATSKERKQARRAAEPPPEPPRPKSPQHVAAGHARTQKGPKLGGWTLPKTAESESQRLEQALVCAVDKRREDFINAILDAALTRRDPTMLKWVVDRVSKAEDADSGPFAEFNRMLGHYRAELLGRRQAGLTAQAALAALGGDFPEPPAVPGGDEPGRERDAQPDDLPDGGRAGGEVDGDRGGLTQLYPLDPAG